MADPLTRSKAVAAMRSLISVRRPDATDSTWDVFYFGVTPEGFMDGDLTRPVEEHRSIALVMASVIDQGLEGAILTKLPGLAPGNEPYLFSDDAAPLRDLDAKIRIGFALQLYGEAVRSDLSLIRSIRNTFAHSRLDLNFDTPEIAAVINFLTLPKRMPLLVNSIEMSNPCQIFVDVALQYAMHMITYGPNEPQSRHCARVLDLPEPPEQPQEQQ